MTEKQIIDAYCKIRSIDNTIPDDVLDFMKKSAIEKIKEGKEIVSLENKVYQESNMRLSPCCSARLEHYGNLGYSECVNCGKTYRTRKITI